MNRILEVEHLKKYFDTPRGQLHAVDDVSFSLEEGKTLGVVGESGCGKSTLGRTILHLIEPTSGKIVFDGKDISRVNRTQWKNLRDDMQIIFQDPMSSLNPRMTVSDIIAEPLRLQRKLKKNEILTEVRKLMNTVGIAARLENSYPHELDGGRRQRIGIARALALEPKFIVCDEPVSALDVSIQAQVLNLLQDLQEERKLSYMFITHDLSVVKYISHDIVVMYLGQLVEKAPSEELFAHPMHPYTQALLSAIPVPDVHAKRERVILKGEITSPVEPKPGCRLIARCRYATEKCRAPQTQIEVSPGHFVSCCRVNELNH
ncbi:ABC transporter ATP-binding protein [Blautia sp. HCP3S3_G3]|uniref:ABC transporter ATP-binding protein n=1 Tax=Blautia sp. HCP3S3_G3 TaxID=3438913 RepID=UPI003F8B1BE9